jgi:hypothetical protein
MASLQIDNVEIVRKVLQIIGAGRDAANMDEATEEDVRQIIRDGMRRFYFPTVGEFVYQWRFRERHHAIPIDVKYETGTITKTAGSGNITLAGGTWPLWLADGFISVDGHILFVDERTSGSVVTTLNTALAVAAGTTYTAYRYRYTLPSDFAEWLGGVTYADGSASWLLARGDESEIRLLYAIGQGQNDRTTHYDITTAPEGEDQHIYFWPVPQPDAFINGTYLSVPDDNLDADLTAPAATVQVSPIYAKVLTEAIFAEAENYLGKTGGDHETRFEKELVRAIAHDKAVGGVYDFSGRVDNDYRGLGRPPESIDFSEQI